MERGGGGTQGQPGPPGPNTTKCLINPKRPPTAGQAVGTNTKRSNTTNYLINPKRTPPGATQEGPIVRGVAKSVIRFETFWSKLVRGVTKVSLARLIPSITTCPRRGNACREPI